MLDRDDLVRFLGIQPGCQLETLSEFFGDAELVSQRFERLESEGLARRTTRGMCLLTDAGRDLRDSLYAAEVAQSGGGPVAQAYVTFEPVNLAFLGWATSWQGREPYADEQALLANLWEIDAELQPLLHTVSAAIPRFGYHQRALNDALTKVEAGELDWLLSPAKASYHTAWFRLHQDWLEALGRERE